MPRTCGPPAHRAGPKPPSPPRCIGSAPGRNPARCRISAMPDDIRTDLQARADALLAKGLRNHWYCIGPSVLVAEKPVPITRLGEKLVLWRDAAGKPHLQADLCPHRNAPLSQGFVKDGLLTCAYHGVQIDGAGCIAGVPAFPPSNLVGQKLVQTYPVVEHFEGLWAYFGESDPVPLELPEELTSTEW